MLLRFTKMHGLGNDFMVLDLVNQRATLTPELVRTWSHRQTGVGFDQLLIIEPTTKPGCDFAYRIYNADGGEVEHCGNGARCVTRFAIDKALSIKREFTFDMARGTIRTRLEDDGLVTVDMGPPRLQPAELPFDAPAQAITYPLDVNGTVLDISAVSMGNPHAVTVVDDTERAPVAELGPLVEAHPRFPQRVNAGFMQIVTPDTIRLRVYERGAGETLTCGTGACAAVVAGRLRGLLDEDVTVNTHGGQLRIRWAGGDAPVWMTGPTATVFEGHVLI
ncbi:MAG: diaminopimelate epimerase [Pseudomonadota bacterium]|nr:diaminopimelate epimerase [Pseudomonadota bacterium]